MNQYFYRYSNFIHRQYVLLRCAILSHPIKIRQNGSLKHPGLKFNFLIYVNLCKQWLMKEKRRVENKISRFKLNFFITSKTCSLSYLLSLSTINFFLFIFVFCHPPLDNVNYLVYDNFKCFRFII